MYIYISSLATDKLVKKSIQESLLEWLWMDGLMGGQMDRQIDVQMDTWNPWMDEWMDGGQTNRWIDAQIAIWKEGKTAIDTKLINIPPGGKPRVEVAWPLAPTYEQVWAPLRHFMLVGKSIQLQFQNHAIYHGENFLAIF